MFSNKIKGSIRHGRLCPFLVVRLSRFFPCVLYSWFLSHSTLRGWKSLGDACDHACVLRWDLYPKRVFTRFVYFWAGPWLRTYVTEVTLLMWLPSVLALFTGEWNHSITLETWLIRVSFIWFSSPLVETEVGVLCDNWCDILKPRDCSNTFTICSQELRGIDCYTSFGRPLLGQ